jgi:hypothetical protein
LEQRISVAQFVQQCLGVFQIRGVEALGEPVVDLGEQCALPNSLLFGKNHALSQVAIR